MSDFWMRLHVIQNHICWKKHMRTFLYTTNWYWKDLMHRSTKSVYLSKRCEEHIFYISKKVEYVKKFSLYIFQKYMCERMFSYTSYFLIFKLTFSCTNMNMLSKTWFKKSMWEKILVHTLCLFRISQKIPFRTVRSGCLLLTRLIKEQLMTVPQWMSHWWKWDKITHYPSLNHLTILTLHKCVISNPMGQQNKLKIKTRNNNYAHINSACVKYILFSKH